MDVDTQATSSKTALECTGKPYLLKAQHSAFNISDSTTIPSTVQNWQITSFVPDSTNKHSTDKQRNFRVPDSTKAAKSLPVYCNGPEKGPRSTKSKQRSPKQDHTHVKRAKRKVIPPKSVTMRQTEPTDHNVGKHPKPLHRIIYQYRKKVSTVGIFSTIHTKTPNRLPTTQQYKPKSKLNIKPSQNTSFATYSPWGNCRNPTINNI